MMKVKEKTCKTCIYSRWPLTFTGRIVRDAPGRCAVPLPVVILPISVTDAYGYNPLKKGNIFVENINCPMHKERDGKPKDLKSWMMNGSPDDTR